MSWLEGVKFHENDWRVVIFDKNSSNSSSNKIGHRLGLPFVRSLQPSVKIRLNDNREFEISQDGTGVLGISGVIWDCGLLFIDFLLHLLNNSLENKLSWKHVLDIGAGTGICGIGSLLLGASQVTFTDSFLTSSLEYNIDTLDEVLRRRYEGIPYKWGTEPLPTPLTSMTDSEGNTIPKKWDVLLCSDLLYESKNHSSLLHFLHHLSYDVIIFSYKKRHEREEEQFFDFLSQDHTVRVIDHRDFTFQNISSESAMSDMYLVIASRSTAV